MRTIDTRATGGVGPSHRMQIEIGPRPLPAIALTSAITAVPSRSA